MNDYELFAQYYDSVMGDRSEYIQLIKTTIEKHKPNSRKILELGCGTGTLIIGLENNYKECYGIDRSVEMLEKAKNKKSTVEFKIADIINFQFPCKFDVIICVFETLNNLQDIGEWESVFKNCHRYLHSSGLLIFDMFTNKRVLNFEKEHSIIKRIGNVIMNLNIVSLKLERTIIWNFEFYDFVKKDITGKFKIEGKTYSMSNVIDILSEFKIIDIKDFRNPLVPIPDSERLLFIAERI